MDLEKKWKKLKKAAAMWFVVALGATESRAFLRDYGSALKNSFGAAVLERRLFIDQLFLMEI